MDAHLRDLVHILVQLALWLLDDCDTQLTGLSSDDNLIDFQQEVERLPDKWAKR